MALSYALLLAGAALFAVLQLLSYVPAYLARRRFKLANGCQPIQRRYPHKYPLGVDLMRDRIAAAKAHKILETNAQLFFDQIQANTFSFRILTSKVITTIEPENVKTILSLKFKDYQLGQRLPTVGILLGKGIFTTDGEAWHQSRTLIRPNFAREQVADLNALERHMSHLFALIPRDGSTVDLQELFFRYTLDSATEFLFGDSVDSLRDELRGTSTEKGFAWAFNHAQHYIAAMTRLGSLYKFYRASQADKDAIKICHDFVDRFVDDAVRYRQMDGDKAAPKDGKYVFLHELARQTDDKRRLRDEVLNVLLAGRDTTASLLGNLFFVIAKEPRIWHTLRQEIEQTLEGQLPTYEQLKSLKYLKWCMNESLRIHPVVPLNSRQAVQDTVLPLGGGPDGRSPLFVPKGTLVSYSTWSMHRRKDIFGSDADEFKPERWANLRTGWEFLPFNGGPRICLGQQYALTEASYVIVRILQEFKDIESRDPCPWEENVSLTLCSLNGTRVGLTPASPR